MTHAPGTTKIDELMSIAPVIPVLVVENVADARPLCEALVAGGLPVPEVTLRTAAALDVIAEMAKVPGAHVGAGTLLTPADLKAAKDAGAVFGVSPGATPALLEAAKAENFPLLPGATSASESMVLLEQGYVRQKFFPAEPAGGAPFLKSLASPLPDIRFCPTGGIGKGNVGDYLALPNVTCVGGSWVAPSAMIGAGDWDGIRALASDAAKL